MFLMGTLKASSSFRVKRLRNRLMKRGFFPFASFQMPLDHVDRLSFVRKTKRFFLNSSHFSRAKKSNDEFVSLAPPSAARPARSRSPSRMGNEAPPPLRNGLFSVGS